MKLFSQRLLADTVKSSRVSKQGEERIKEVTLAWTVYFFTCCLERRLEF
jgi:hypothetical protein